MKLPYLKFIIVFTILTAGMLFLPYELLAQGPPPPPPPPPGGGPPCWPPPCVPINKGLIFLAIAAFLLAAYNLKIFRTKTK